MNARVLVTVVLLAAAGGATWYFLRKPDTALTTPPPAPAPTPEKPPAGDPPIVEKAKVEAIDPIAKLPAEDIVPLPDGTTVPALNGAKGITDIGWPKDIPYAPVVGKVWHVNKYWYQHADGSYSTFFVDTNGMSWAHVANPVTPISNEQSDGPAGPRLPGNNGN